MAEKLSTPQNVKISSDGKLTFDAVPNATSYNILANNTVIGNSEGVSTNMAEKTLKTRIQLRFDTYDKWVENNPVLKRGEVAVVQIDTKDPANKLLPPIMFKVGTGESGDASRFNSLNWTSALAADVYDWAKASAKPSYDYSEIKNTPTIPSVGNGKITIKQAGSEKGSFTVNQTGNTVIELTDTDTKVTDTDTQYQLVLSGHTLKLQSKAKGGSWADVSGQSFTLPDNNTTYTFASTATSGASFKVTPSGGTAQTVHIDGLGTAAFKAVGDFDEVGSAAAVLGTSTDAATANTVYGAKKAAAAAQSTADTAKTTANAALPKSEFDTFKTANDTALAGKVSTKTTVNGHALSENVTVTKSDVGLGSVQNKALDTTVTKDSGNYITSGAVRSAIDSAISGVTQFDIAKYDSFDKLPATGKKGVIYIIAHSHSDSNDSYDEYIWNTTLTTPAYEKIGNTDVNLTDYVKTLSGTANSGVITNLTKSGNTLTVTSKSLATIAPTANGTALAFIDSVSQAADGKITATKKTVSDATTTAHGLMTAADKVKLNGIAEGATKVTDTTVSGWGYIKSYTDTNQKIKAKSGSTDVTFGDNDVVEFVAGSNVTISPDKTNKKITIAATQKSDTAINGLIDTKLTAYTTAHPGVDKVGTVTTVSAAANSGFKITGTATTAPTIDWDDTVTLVFDCGDSSDT